MGRNASAKMAHSARLVVNQRGPLGPHGQLVPLHVAMALQPDRGGVTRPEVRDARRDRALKRAHVTMVRVPLIGATGAPAMPPVTGLCRAASSMVRSLASAHSQMGNLATERLPACSVSATKLVPSVVQLRTLFWNAPVTVTASESQRRDVVTKQPAGDYHFPLGWLYG